MDVRRFIHRHQLKVSWRVALLAGLGVALVIGILGWISDFAQASLVMAPFGASSVLLLVTPHAPFSQPVNLIGGHCLAAAIGIAVFSNLPAGFVAAGISVGTSLVAMLVLRLVHPPAGATALVAATAKGWSFVLFPVLAGSLALVALAVAYHRLSGVTYPLHLPGPRSGR